jgi:hypothetical protein
MAMLNTLFILNFLFLLASYLALMAFTSGLGLGLSRPSPSANTGLG